MKILKEFIAAVFIIAIFAGVGYLGWSLFMTPGGNTLAADLFSKIKPQAEKQPVPRETTANTAAAPQDTTAGTNEMTGMDMADDTNSDVNIPEINYVVNRNSVQNKERLNQAAAIINQVLEQITVDPYVSTTIITPKQNMQATQAPQTLTINPSGSTTINIPSGTQPQQMTQESTNSNFVFDQAKLQQLNTAIFTISQGVEELNRLGEELSVQASQPERNPADYQTYIERYNKAFQNKSRLNSAQAMLAQISVLTNTNPYASADGYKFDVSGMKKLHDGVFKLAKANSQLLRLNEDFTLQMNEAYAKAQELADASNKAALDAANKSAYDAAQKQALEYAKAMEEAAKAQNQLLKQQNGNSVYTTIVYFVMILFILGLIAGIIGGLFTMLSPKKTAEKAYVEKDSVLP